MLLPEVDDMATLNVLEGKLALSCKYEERDMAKNVPGYRWDKELKVWSYPVDFQTIMDIKAQFPDLHISTQVRLVIERVLAKRRELVSIKDANDADINVSYASLLRDYQRVGVRFLSRAKRAILGDDMGTGKTIQAITTCEAQGFNRVLVVCPSGVKRVWKAEIKKWTNSDCTLVEGCASKRHEQITSFAGKYLITNYEALVSKQTDEDGATKIKLNPDLAAITWDTVIFDEAHRLKNRKAQRTQAAADLKTKDVYMLSGTPMLNRPDELWSLLNILYPTKFTSYWRFVDRYCAKENNDYGVEIKESDDDQKQQLRELLAPVMIRRMKRDVLTELPEKVYQTIPVALVGKQKRIYDQMERAAFAQIGSKTVTAPVVIAQITRLRQIAISPELLGEDCKDSSKLDTLVDFLEDQVSSHKVVVFSQFEQAIQLAGKRLTEAGIKWVAVTGKVSQADRDEATRKLQEDPETRVMLATIEAGGLGLTWTAADIAVFLDKHWTPKINEQAEDRLHRMGQRNSVTIVSLFAEDTVEERIEDILSGKARQFAEIIDGANTVTVQTYTTDMVNYLFRGRQ
jgi:SNF2 family DNA or RNA helicase